TSQIYTLSLHDALPIFSWLEGTCGVGSRKLRSEQGPQGDGHWRFDHRRLFHQRRLAVVFTTDARNQRLFLQLCWPANFSARRVRSEEHTSELQSRSDLV